MLTDDDSHPVEGEIVGPEGPGRWMPLTEAQPLLGIPQKTLYRRAERGQIPARKNDAGRIEVWVADAPAEERRLSPIVGLDTVEVSELLAPLAQSLADSQREALTATDRAARAEEQLKVARERIAELEARQSRREPERIEDTYSWWRFWERWWRSTNKGTGNDS